MTRTAVIIDDEKPGRDHIVVLLSRVCPDVEVVGTAASVCEGVSIIKDTQPDIVFLDISMPGETGFDLLDQVGGRDFALIFVTAHAEYALQAIKAQTVDYLLKPLDMDDLVIAVEKAVNYLDMNALKETTNPSQAIPLEERTVSIPMAMGLKVIRIKHIIYLRAKGNYTFIHLHDNSSGVLLSKNLGQMEALLPDSIFFRSHKSYLINMHCLEEYKRGEESILVMNNGDEVGISRRKKAELHARLNNMDI